MSELEKLKLELEETKKRIDILEKREMSRLNRHKGNFNKSLEEFLNNHDERCFSEWMGEGDTSQQLLEDKRLSCASAHRYRHGA